MHNRRLACTSQLWSSNYEARTIEANQVYNGRILGGKVVRWERRARCVLCTAWFVWRRLQTDVCGRSLEVGKRQSSGLTHIVHRRASRRSPAIDDIPV
eukprot:6085090-Pleurochrysis_carterae.AAC.4